jgi:inorganic pyrophosphatase
VPVPKVFPSYEHMTDIGDVPQHWRDRIGYFFEHYKDLEPGKWVKLDGWGNAADARRILSESIERYEALPVKPHF